MSEPRPPLVISPLRLLVWALGFATATGLCILVLDGIAARMLAKMTPASEWAQLLHVLETPAGLTLEKREISLGFTELNVTRWAYALGLGLIALVTLAVPRLRRFAHIWCFVTLAHLISRLAMVELKEGTGRLRPGEWLAAGGGETFFREGGLSFPSGHVTYFLSLILPAVIALSPRYRDAVWLLLIPLLVAACRVAENAHFLSDVTGAVTLVCVVSAVLAAIFKPWTRKA